MGRSERHFEIELIQQLLGRKLPAYIRGQNYILVVKTAIHLENRPRCVCMSKLIKNAVAHADFSWRFRWVTEGVADMDLNMGDRIFEVAWLTIALTYSLLRGVQPLMCFFVSFRYSLKMNVFMKLHHLLAVRLSIITLLCPWKELLTKLITLAALWKSHLGKNTLIMLLLHSLLMKLFPMLLHCNQKRILSTVYLPAILSP